VAPIYNGGDATTDADWTDLAMARAHEYEQVVGGKPDFVTLQSWMDKPDHLLPESDPTTFTGLINRYLAPRTVLTLDGPAARLTTADGAGIANAPIKASVAPIDGVRQILRVDGVVPEGATTAVAGIRVNVEGAGPGEADLRVYEMKYTESGGDNMIQNARFSGGLTNWGVDSSGTAKVVASDGGDGKMLVLAAGPNELIVVNSTGFPVRAGAAYHFELMAKVPALSAGSAYAAIMFLAANEIGRDRIQLAPAPIDLETVTTDATGNGAIDLAQLSPGRYTLSLDYAGGLDYWPARVEDELTVR
jgi:hypothetical protein